MKLKNFFDNIAILTFDNISQNKSRNTNNICMFHEQMLSNLQSEIIVLREKVKLKDGHFRDEILCIWEQLEECLHLSSLKLDINGFL